MNRQEWIEWMDRQTGNRLPRLLIEAGVEMLWVERDKNYEVLQWGYSSPRKFKSKRSAVRYIKRLLLKSEAPLPRKKFVTNAVRKELIVKEEQNYFDRLGY